MLKEQFLLISKDLKKPQLNQVKYKDQEIIRTFDKKFKRKKSLVKFNRQNFFSYDNEQTFILKFKQKSLFNIFYLSNLIRIYNIPLKALLEMRVM